MAKREKIVSNIQKLSQDYEMISVSHHESSHVIIGLLFHLKIPKVTINYTAKSVEGFTNYETLETDDRKINNYVIMSEIYISYAGLLAEKILYKEMSGSDKFPMVLRDGSSPDILSASELISKNNLVPPGKPRQELKKKIYKELTAILKEHWEAVRLVAHALYEKKKLSEQDLKNLLTKKSQNKKFWREQFKKIETLTNSSEPLDAKEIRFILNDKCHKNN